MVDVEDTIVEVHAYAKQGTGFGYSRVRRLNALLATVSTDQAAPVIVAQWLSKGSVGSPRGADQLVAHALATVARVRDGQEGRPVLVRADSAFCGQPTIGAAVRAGAQISITARLTSNMRAAIATITEQA